MHLTRPLLAVRAKTNTKRVNNKRRKVEQLNAFDTISLVCSRAKGQKGPPSGGCRAKKQIEQQSRMKK